MRFFRRPASFRVEERLLEDAEHRLLERCMDRKGHRIRFPAARTFHIIGRLTPDLAFRRRYGYGFAEPKRPAVQEEKIPESRAAQARLARAYAGNEDHVVHVRGPETVGATITEGCWGAARRAVYGTIHQYAEANLTSEYSALIGLRIGRGREYQGVPMHRWSRCMAKRGHHYKDLNGPYFDAQYAYQYADPKPAHVSRREIKLAVDDGECEIAVGLPAITRRLQDKYVAALPAKERRRLSSIARVRAEAVTRARRIVAKYGRGQ